MNKEQALSVANEIKVFPFDFKSVTLAKLPSTGAGDDSIVLTFDNKYKVKITANGKATYSIVHTTTVEGFEKDAPASI